MRSLRLWGVTLFMLLFMAGVAREANAQVVYYTSRPVVVGAGYPYYGYPTYTYYGGWYPGSYQNMYGNYGAYHVMTPVWTGGYRYYYRY